MFRKTLMLVAVAMSACGAEDAGGAGAHKSSLPENYGHGCSSDRDCDDVDGASCNGSSGLMCTVACGETSKCAAGTTCINNSCSQTCSKSADCSNGGECVFPDGSNTGICGYPSQAPVGAHCKHAYECGTRDCRSTPLHPDGYCTATCSTNEECGGDSLCIFADATSDGFCAPRCASPGTRGSCTNESTCHALQSVTYGFCY